MQDKGSSWREPQSKKRQTPQPILSQSFEVSRQSGLASTVGTFGGAQRFDTGEKVRGRGRDSPNGREFYGRNQLWKSSLEVGPMCSQGVGDRERLDKSSTPVAVGPGSYEIVASAAKARSPLDGPDFCNMTMHKKLPSKLVPFNLCSPGPHHNYQIRKPLDHHIKEYAKQSLSHGARHPYPEDTDGPGISYAHASLKGLSQSVSSPSLKTKGKDDTTARPAKCTFGNAGRFSSKKLTSSPSGDMYYVHSKILTSEDYLQSVRTCSFGAGNKTDFSNPFHGHRSDVSAVTYSPVTSTSRKTSALDGLVTRLESPTRAACRSLQVCKP